MSPRQELLAVARASPETMVDCVLALEEQLGQSQQDQVRRLGARIAELEARLAQNSSNSGRPPSNAYDVLAPVESAIIRGIIQADAVHVDESGLLSRRLPALAARRLHSGTDPLRGAWESWHRAVTHSLPRIGRRSPQTPRRPPPWSQHSCPRY